MLMADTQKTQPRPRKKGKVPEPIEIPIPAKRDVFGDLAKTANPRGEQRKDRRQRQRGKRP